MRTGAEYRESLRDGRKVWIIGEGLVEDVNTHRATKGMVDEYVAWYDRHFDPEWQDIVLMPPDGAGKRLPASYVLPQSIDDLRRMARCYTSTLFLSAGNITHTPAYGNIIALGILHTVQEVGTSQEQIANAAAYRESIARTGRFLTFSSGGATIGYRLREDANERSALKIVKETDTGLVVNGKVGMHTSPAFAEDVYIGALSGVDYGEQRASFIVPVNAPGVTIVCRKPAARYDNAFMAPLSSRYDELDGQMWLEDVLVPWERIFLVNTPGQPNPTPEGIAYWLFWHQLYAWLAKAEFTLGLALACTDAMGLKEHPQTQEYIVDLLEAVQTVRTCQTAAELDPEITKAGYYMPNQLHVSAGSLAMQKARQRMSEILRILPGSSLVVAPSDTDLQAPDMRKGLEESFGGGGYTAQQRSALLQMTWDHISSGLDGRESAFELHANGGIPAWRGRLRRHFMDYSDLANRVLQQLDLEMPEVDLESLRNVAQMPRRQVSVPVDSTTSPEPAKTPS
ncbi:MAG TPA: 4-hydroxyphenylacetate 3-hydroxylase N-terminal domain-containing protein [Dehalococcoidia bacterium]|nr:4-hydroxyphenylacetate 3-hydroxylase N-terminal domain-containing protein [Dehalococcoidia bacterium]